ncbi:hypothetical protein FACS1894217_08300 [Clostridia bacterium]|nr:hypothetical protein FACS1894217_08300 [Clostridia bacterium]
MINFIIRHKDSCEVIVRNADGSVINVTNAPDYYFDTAYLFDKILNGHGERKYNAIRIERGIDDVFGTNTVNLKGGDAVQVRVFAISKTTAQTLLFRLLRVNEPDFKFTLAGTVR